MPLKLPQARDKQKQLSPPSASNQIGSVKTVVGLGLMPLRAHGLGQEKASTAAGREIASLRPLSNPMCVSPTTKHSIRKEEPTSAATKAITNTIDAHWRSTAKCPATRNRTRDHLIAAAFYSQMLYQLSYSRLACNRSLCSAFGLPRTSASPEIQRRTIWE